ncbi:uncharacterized protein CLUP02_02003 [Colletotrichum lupini]|uniref:Secreted protein n=1 Tax=Colletotrichum lupini TaxID=145971 RepID=A0A9Q8SDG0_9PEZI|nr:uncharacterized protein CLUP02_02003 [Colletotrichum lupini]KAK1712018.1 hypothetical protein BDP67DRAFT_60874 [Colletotrichum lupini]UQC75349.1 hypothetical protein CLUP02_02003 [Colletotrichum lupini]
MSVVMSFWWWLSPFQCFRLCCCGCCYSLYELDQSRRILLYLQAITFEEPRGGALRVHGQTCLHIW